MVFSKKNLNSKEPAKNQWPVLYQFFHENRWCFEAFETTSIDGSLILKYLKNWNQSFFEKFKEPPNTGLNLPQGAEGHNKLGELLWH